MISVGVVGAGYWGPNIVRNFWEINDTRVLMCCDVRPERLEFIKKRYPSIEVTTNYEDMLKNGRIDAISIATHAQSHYELAKKALKSGKHLLIEKPITLCSDEALELIDLSEKYNRVIMVGHILEYSGPVETIKGLIETGDLGQIFYLDSVRVNLQPFREDVNVLWDLGPHDVSLAMFLLDQDPISTSVIGESYISDFQENIAFGVLRFPNKILSHFHLSWLAPMKMRQTIVVGSKKMVVFDDVDQIAKLKIYDKGVDLTPDPSGLTERQMILRKGNMHCPKVDTREPLMREVHHFIDCIKNNKTPRSDGIKGWKVVKIIEAMQESMRSGGKEVAIDLRI
ncbi:MAG: Gfo/Idh/MocA family oxidoreductase [Candidatus Eremiobacteraeota bacterium]|nr:Gfo/Idh/MocA family oxidoreductase [Candidatus Eremiobacteraeota bacterium]